MIIQTITGSPAARTTVFPSAEESHTGHRVEGLDARQGYCFQVGIVLSAEEVKVGDQACVDQAA